MNGYILFTEGKNTQKPSPARIAPICEGSTYDLKQFGSGEYLLTWGNTRGDVCYVGNGNKAILILSGYIVEVESGPAFKSKDEAARYLLTQFMTATSDMALEHLLDRIYGSFGIIFRDQVRDITICVTDRVSSRPIWRCREDSRWVVSTHAAALALSIAHPHIDLAGIGAFMLYGGPISPERCLFEDVKAIPAGSIARLGCQGESSLFKWYQYRHMGDRQLSPEDWTELVASRLVRAATRIGQNSRAPAIFFSGGVDSRLVASAMKSARINPLLVTLADGKNIEVHVASLAAKALGLDHTVIIRDRHWYLRKLPRTVYESGGNYVWTHGHFSTAAEMVSKEKGVDVFLLGDFCEAFSKLLCSLEHVKSAKWTYEDFAKAFDSIRLPNYRPYNRGTTLSLFKSDVRKKIEDAIYSEIEQRFKEVCSLASDPLIVGDLCFRWEAVTICPTFFMFLDLRSTSAERNIMFDRDVHELLEILPSNIRNGKNFGANVIKRLQPMAASVINSNSLLPMIWPASAHKMSKQIKPIFGKVRRFMTGKTHRTTGSWTEHAMLYETDPLWRQYFERILENEEMFDPTVFDMTAIRRCWKEFSNGQMNRSADIEKLVQIGLLWQMLDRGASNVAVQESVIRNDRMASRKS